MPDGNLSPQFDAGSVPPAKTKKKPRVSLIIGLAVAAAALLAVAALFLISYFSANSRFNRAMEGGDFEDNDAYVPREMNENDEVFHSNEELLKIISELWVKVKNTK